VHAERVESEVQNEWGLVRRGGGFIKDGYRFYTSMILTLIFNWILSSENKKKLGEKLHGF
jgi:hypothetical protein